MKTITLDPGHGGMDSGAVGNGMKEKDVTLSVALKTGEVLKRHNVDVKYTRNTDEAVSLSERSYIANIDSSDIFVSIHCNSFGNGQAQGLETFSHPNSRNGTALAKCIQNSLLRDKLYTKNRGVKTANFAVLRLTKMPSALVELAFISNEEDSGILKNKQNELAISVAKGILNFIGIKYMEEDKNMYKIKINLHGQEVEVEGIAKDLEGKGNKTQFIPIRFLEKLGYDVGWDNKKKIVTVNYIGGDK